MSGAQVCPARNARRGGVARGGIALTLKLTLHICIKNRPYSRPKIASPTYSASAQAKRKYHLCTSGGRVRGRPAERSGGGCPERVWTAVSAPWVPDTGTGRLPRFRRTNFSTGFPRALRRKELRAALSGGGQRRVPFAPATGAARSGPALTPLRCQRPAGKRQDVVDVERPSNLELQQAHQLPRPSPASGAASAAAFALVCLVLRVAAAAAPIARRLLRVVSAAYENFTSHG